MPNRPTIREVALEAGVSIKTVSRVVNKEPHVSAGVRDAVEKAIASLGYRPNTAARAMGSGRSLIIGMLTPAIGSAYFGRLQGEVLGACRERGYHLMVEQVGDAQVAAAQVKRFISERQIDGLLLAAGVAEATEIREVIRAVGVRFVAISPRDETGLDLVVAADEQQGERNLADTMWALGHRRFAIAKPPAFWRFTRGEAFAQRLLELGAAPSGIIEFPYDWRIPALEGGRRMAIDILTCEPRPTALFAISDELAAGAIGLCLTRGLLVPGDISIAGFDDDQIAQATWPTLTTIRLPLRMMMQHALDMLVGKGQSALSKRVVCPVELVLRDSLTVSSV